MEPVSLPKNAIRIKTDHLDYVLAAASAGRDGSLLPDYPGRYVGGRRRRSAGHRIPANATTRGGQHRPTAVADPPADGNMDPGAHGRPFTDTDRHPHPVTNAGSHRAL